MRLLGYCCTVVVVSTATTSLPFSDSAQHLPPSQQQSALSHLVQTQLGHSHGTGADTVDASLAALACEQQADFAEQHADFSALTAMLDSLQVLPLVHFPAGHSGASHPTVVHAEEHAATAISAEQSLQQPVVFAPLAEQQLPHEDAGVPAMSEIAESVILESPLVPLAAITPPTRATLINPANNKALFIFFFLFLFNFQEIQ
jgi:hypothetical protein